MAFSMLRGRPRILNTLIPATARMNGKPNNKCAAKHEHSFLTFYQSMSVIAEVLPEILGDTLRRADLRSFSLSSLRLLSALRRE